MKFTALTFDTMHDTRGTQHARSIPKKYSQEVYRLVFPFLRKEQAVRMTHGSERLVSPDHRVIAGHPTNAHSILLFVLHHPVVKSSVVRGPRIRRTEMLS